MRKQALFAAAAILGLLSLAACGGSNRVSGTLGPGTSGPGTSTVSFIVHDDPPSGVTVLSFIIHITGASLQPADASKPAVALLTSPVAVELADLQTAVGFLGSRNVPADTYNSLTVTFANPKMTIFNQTGGTLTVNGQSCANGQACRVSPALNASSATIAAPTPPFPLVLAANAPIALQLDFNVKASLQQADLSVTPTISVQQIPVPSQLFPNVLLKGKITNVDAANQQFTLQVTTDDTTQSEVIKTDANTVFAFGDECPQRNFSCLAVGETVRVKAQVQADGSLLARGIQGVAHPNQAVIEGTVIGVNTTTNEFQIVGLQIEFDGTEFSVPLGIPVFIQVTSHTTFSMDSDSLTIPGGLTLAGLGDMIVGQRVEVHPTGISLMPPGILLTAGSVELEPSQGSATVGSVNAANNSFTLTNLPGLFTHNGITQILVQAETGVTEFENVSGAGGLSPGDQVSVAGLLFKNGGSPEILAEVVRKRLQD